MEAHKHVDEVAQLLGMTEPQSLGGGLQGFMYEGDNGEQLIFGYANDSLGYSFYQADGTGNEGADMEDKNADAHAQVEFIEATLKKYGIEKL